MSRRKQQNPKPLKFEGAGVYNSHNQEDLSGIQSEADFTDDGLLTVPVIESDKCEDVKVEPMSPSESEEAESLSRLLGVPDEAPLKVERCHKTGLFKILSSMSISKGAGLDPLKAQPVNSEDLSPSPEAKCHIVTFVHKTGTVHFQLETQANCGWLKYLGVPSPDQEANLRIYYVGGQLWVEVMKDLSAGDELIAEFCDPTHRASPVKQPPAEGSPESKELKLETANRPDAPLYMCPFCGINFRSPSTLFAHRKHYCTKSDAQGERSLNSDCKIDHLQSAYVCLVCSYMAMGLPDMEKHLHDNHSTATDSGESAVASSKALSSGDTFCADCEIHFKRPDSYQAHKLHYCKNRKDNHLLSEATPAASNLAASPVIPKELYKKVSIVDSSLLSANPLLPSSTAPPVLGPFSASPVKIALPSKAPSPAAAGTPVKPPETPLDLRTEFKRKHATEDDQLSRVSSTPQTSPQPSKISKVISKGTIIKPAKLERHIFRCEHCSIPFYKRDVYEAHKLHYCSARSASGSEKSNSPKLSNPLPVAEDADERLVITYTCSKCSTSYRTIETFKAHDCSFITQPLLQCEECDFKHVSRQAVLEHAESHKKVNVAYKCNICGYLGNTMRGMRQHGRQHAERGEDFSDSDVSVIEQPALVKPHVAQVITALPGHGDMEEELLRLKNEPYKRRRSRRVYHKSAQNSLAISPIPSNKKENGFLLQRQSADSSPRSMSSASPLQNSTFAFNNEDSSAAPDQDLTVKKEPVETIADVIPVLRKSNSNSFEKVNLKSAPIKSHVCSCNASFAYSDVFEAHKKLYCPNNKRSSPAISVSQ